MKRIAMVVPYFGTFPNYFPLWLESCGGNPDVDFLIFTDDRTAYDYPPNARVTYMSWQQMQKRITDFFPFPAAISRPYKLCDYRPAFGQLFAPELSGYDFWGHCDLDVVWGCIRDFVTEDLLEQYDRLFYRGHFSLYRNTEKINRLYQNPVEGAPLYRQVFQDEAGHVFDEWTGIGRIFDEAGISVYDSPVVADINSDKWHFVVNSDREDKERRQLFMWRNPGGISRIFRYYGDDEYLVKQQFMYIHLQKREMAFYGTIPKDKEAAFLIVPNRFVPGSQWNFRPDDGGPSVPFLGDLLYRYYKRRPINWPLVKKRLAKKLGRLFGRTIK